jgi:ring-1,2-phenylacetyl-CoA epoxidase subunit PaaE
MRISLDVPDELRQEFDFLPGQHLPIQVALDGRKLRRTYSICSPPGQYPVEIGVRVQPGGRFGRYAASELSAGDRLDSMPPSGRFYVTPDPSRARTCVVFAAGSGITPVLSIVRTVLELEPHSRVMLFYGNRRRSSTMFIDDLYASACNCISCSARSSRSFRS